MSKKICVVCKKEFSSIFAVTKCSTACYMSSSEKDYPLYENKRFKRTNHMVDVPTDWDKKSKKSLQKILKKTTGVKYEA